MSALTRRTFLQFSAFAGVAHLIGCTGAYEYQRSDTAGAAGKGAVAYKRTGRGRRVSNAAKKHNANHLYASAKAAAADPAHSGDNSKVVPVSIPQELFNEVFANGRANADLRHVL